MKKIITILTSIILILSLSSCSMSKGAPESLILRDAKLKEGVSYKIVHNYDPSTHIDDVELITSLEGEFGSVKQTYVCSYQYDRSTDLWSQYDDEFEMKSGVIDYNEKVYSKNKYFEGDFERYETGRYEITIEKVDFKNKTAKIKYYLLFDRDGMVLQDTKTFNLSEEDSGTLCFSIDYKRSMVVHFSQTFIFDIKKGISVVD